VTFVHFPDNVLETSGESREVANTCPMFCRMTPHHCWYVGMGMELAALIRRWLARPVLEDGRAMTVLDELFQSHLPERSLQDVVAASLRQIRRALEQSGNSGAQAQAELPPPQPVSVDNSVASGEPLRRVRTRSRGIQTVRRRSRITPLMSIRCQRPQQGLLGPGPGSLEWARHYCRELLAQTRRQ
jgi:hypothetical protein